MTLRRLRGPTLTLALLLLASAGARAADDTAPVAVPEPSPTAMRYYYTGLAIWAGEEVLAVVAPLIFLFTGASAGLRNAARRIARGWFIPTAGLYVAGYLLLFALISLPMEFAFGFVRQHEYGLSDQSPWRWLTHWATALGVSSVMALVFGWIPFGVIRLSPRRWWFWTALLTVPLIFFIALIKPIWFDPLFNKFGPMHDKALEARILDLADRAGIRGGHVYEVDKSLDTKTVNAYVTGFGDTKRIVLWDTLLKKLDEPEVLVIMGHEMGHYVLGHVVRGIVASSIANFVGMILVYLIATRMIARWGASRFGFDRLSDPAALPLLIAVGVVVSFVVAPFVYAYSRHMEHEADRFSLELTRSNHAAAVAFVKLQQENLANPRPEAIVKLLRSTHPTLAERIDFCNEYRPWDEGRPLVYDGFFRPHSPGP